MAPQSLHLPTIVVGTLLFGRTTAWTTFKANCTLPAHVTNYVANPNARGTLGIFWECLLIIILCTWTILHLNVPVIRPEPKSFIRTCWRVFEDSVPKAKWMTVTFFVPEYILAKAFMEFLAARRANKNGVRIAPTKAQAHLANMGYFVLDTENMVQNTGDYSSHDTNQEGDPDNSDFNREEWLDKQHEFNNRIRSSIHRQICKSSPFKSRYWALNVAQWHKISRSQPEFIDFPILSYSQLQQLGGQDALVRMLALVQILYLIAQLIIRQCQHLPISQLEITTLAFAVCSVFVYVLYWNRPQHVQSIHNIKPNRTLSPKEFQALVSNLDHYSPRFLWPGCAAPNLFPHIGPFPIPNDATSRIGKSLTGQLDQVDYSTFFGAEAEITILGALVSLVGALFGGLHCLAWNFDFPTRTEALLWKVSSVATTVLPLTFVGFFFGRSWSSFIAGIVYINRDILSREMWTSIILKASGSWRWPFKTATKLFIRGVLLISMVSYSLARLFLLVESVRTLFYLPPGAYKATWAGINLPHF